jgi:ClpP class serine protease
VPADPPTAGDILWLFFMISEPQPVIKQCFLEATRQRFIAKIERQRNSRVILLVHRQETMSILGFPAYRYIDVNDSEEALRAINKHQGKVTAFCAALCDVRRNADRVGGFGNRDERGRHARTGGPSAWTPLASILKAVEKKPVEMVKDDTLILADQAQKAVSQIRKSVCEFLAPRGAEKASKLAKLLSEGTRTHDHPITFETAQSFGLLGAVRYAAGAL